MKNGKRLLSLTLAASMITSMFLSGIPVSAANNAVDSGMWAGTTVDSMEFTTQDSGVTDQQIDLEQLVDSENGVIYLAPSYDWDVYDEDGISFEDHISNNEITPNIEDQTQDGETIYKIPASELTPDEYSGAALINVTIPKLESEGDDDFIWRINVPLSVSIKAETNDDGTLDEHSVAYITERLDTAKNGDTVKVTVDTDPSKTVTVPAETFENLTTGKILEITVTSNGESVTWSFSGTKNANYDNVVLSVETNKDDSLADVPVQTVDLAHDGNFPTETVTLTVPNKAKFSGYPRLELLLVGENNELTKAGEVVANNDDTITLTLPHASKWVVAPVGTFDAKLDFESLISFEQIGNGFTSIDITDLTSDIKEARSDYFNVSFDWDRRDINKDLIKDINFEIADPSKYPGVSLSIASMEFNSWGNGIDIRGRFVLTDKDTELSGMYAIPVKLSFKYGVQNAVKTAELPLYIAEGDPVFIDGMATVVIDSLKDSYESSKISIYAPGQEVESIAIPAGETEANWDVKLSSDKKSFTLIKERDDNGFNFSDLEVPIEITLKGSSVPAKFTVETDIYATPEAAGASISYDETLKLDRDFTNGPYTLVNIETWNNEPVSEEDEDYTDFYVEVVDLYSTDPDMFDYNDNIIEQQISGTDRANFDVYVLSPSESQFKIDETAFYFEYGGIVRFEGLHVNGINFEEQNLALVSRLQDITETELDINNPDTYTRTMRFTATSRVKEITGIEFVDNGDNNDNSYFTIDAGSLKKDGSAKNSWTFTLTLKNAEMELPQADQFQLDFLARFTTDTSKNGRDPCDAYIDFVCGDNKPIKTTLTYLEDISGNFYKGESIKLLLTSEMPVGYLANKDDFRLNIRSSDAFKIIRGSAFYSDMQRMEIITLSLTEDYDSNGYYGISVAYNYYPEITNSSVKLYLPENISSYNNDGEWLDLTEIIGNKPITPSHPSGGNGGSSGGGSSSGGGGGYIGSYGPTGGIIILDGSQQIPGEPVPWDGVTVGPTGGALVLDTKNYTMTPGGIYDVLMTLVGADVSEMRIYSSRSGVADIASIGGGKYRVTAIGPGETYIMFEVWRDGVMLSHASVKITVAEGAVPSGESNRAASLF